MNTVSPKSPAEPSMDATEADLRDPKRRAEAIGAAPLFRTWPAAALLRLARAAAVTTHSRGTLVVERGPSGDVMTTVVHGTVLACVTSPEGKRVAFKIAAGASVHGLIPLVDAEAMINDVIALDTVTAVRIPHAALRAELQASPALWESVALDLAGRARGYTEQLKRFVFDQPRVHLAILLTGLIRSAGADTGRQAVQIDQRLPQELIADMLGISRQWASTLIRDMVQDGLVRWRYGRVTVVDVEQLRKIAERGVNAPP